MKNGNAGHGDIRMYCFVELGMQSNDGINKLKNTKGMKANHKGSGVLPESIVSGPLIKVSIKWEDIVSAVLRERENAMSRTDHLLVIKSTDKMLSYNTSTLSDEDDRKVIEIVGKKTNLVVQKDKPTI